MLLNIVKNPNEILRKKSLVIDLNKEKLDQLILDMSQTMKENNGIGLAAPQIGQNIRLVLIETKDGVLPLINPVIIKKSWGKEWGEEGCLSINNTLGDVKRSKKIKVKALSSDNQEMEFEAHGLFARVIQHEVDHLNGILFIDKAKNIKNTASNKAAKKKER